jgi:chemotaxis protein MotB
MKYVPILLVIFGGYLSSCVPQQKYLDLEKEKQQLQAEVNTLDSVATSREQVETDLVEMESELAQAYREIEGLRSTNVGLNQSYQDLLQRYTRLVNQNNEIVNSSGDRQYNLQQELQMQRQELLQKEQELREREARLNNLQNNYSTDINNRQQIIQQLQQEIQRRDEQLRLLKSNVDSDLGAINLRGVQVSQTNGQIAVTLSQELLFNTGSSFVGSNGRQAIRQLTNTLINNPNVDIVVEGHTDNQGDPNTNWKLSIERANAVARLMMVQGIAPERITISGRGQYDPVATNASAAGRVQNRRTEILLIPKSENIDNLLDRQ